MTFVFTTSGTVDYRGRGQKQNMTRLKRLLTLAAVLRKNNRKLEEA